MGGFAYFLIEYPDTTDPKTLPIVSTTKNVPDDLFEALIVLVKYSLMFEIIWEALA